MKDTRSLLFKITSRDLFRVPFDTQNYDEICLSISSSPLYLTKHVLLQASQANIN